MDRGRGRRRLALHPAAVAHRHRLDRGASGNHSPGQRERLATSGPALELRRATHKAIASVTDDIEKFRFNRGVARLYEFANTLAELKDGDLADAAGIAAGARRWTPWCC